MPRTLITGGLGFLGTWLATALRRCDHEVVLVDQRPVGDSPAALSGLLDDPAVRVGAADLTVPGALDEFGEVDYVVHAAAVLGVRRVRESPWETMRVNTAGTETALRYAVRQPALRRFVLFSTSEVYGEQADRPGEEDWLSVRTDDPRWSYAVSKVAAEAMTTAYHTEHGLPFVTVRPFNVYGPLRTGSYAVAAMVSRALANEPMTLHGGGAQRRAWCHVEDFVNGVARCLHSPEIVGQAVNIGDDRHVLSVAELAERIRELAKSRSDIVQVPHDGPDIQHRRPDLTRARTVLGYEPIRGLDEGLSDTIEWMRTGSGPYRIRWRRQDWPAWR